MQSKPAIDRSENNGYVRYEGIARPLYALAVLCILTLSFQERASWLWLVC